MANDHQPVTCRVPRVERRHERLEPRFNVRQALATREAGPPVAPLPGPIDLLAGLPAPGIGSAVWQSLEVADEVPSQRTAPRDGELECCAHDLRPLPHRLSTWQPRS